MKYHPATLSCGTSAFCINLENSEISQKFYHQTSKKLFPTRRKSRDRDCVEWHRAKAFRVKIHSQHEAVPTESYSGGIWGIWNELHENHSGHFAWAPRFWSGSSDLFFYWASQATFSPLNPGEELWVWWDFQALFKYVTTLSLKTGLEIESAQKAPLKLGLIKYLFTNIY